MLFYKKLTEENTFSYHACSKTPPNLDGLIEITAEEYNAAIDELEAEEVEE